MLRRSILVMALIALTGFSTTASAAWHAPGLGVDARSLTSATVIDPLTVIASDTVNAGSFAVQRVLCPDGMVALSGGIDMSNVSTMKVTSSAPVFGGADERLLSRPDGSNPAPFGWQATALNEGASSAVFRVGVVCARLAGASAMVASDTAPAGSFGTERVLCPAGQVAVGGGIDTENVLTMEISSSAPSFEGSEMRLIEQSNGSHPAPIGWQASAVNRAASSQTFKVGVVCAAIDGVTAVVSSDKVYAGSFGVEREVCPSGQAALGGGVDNFNVLTMQVSSSAPTFDRDEARLISQGSGRGPAPNGWQVSSVNEEATDRMLKVATICSEVEYQVQLPLITRDA